MTSNTEIAQLRKEYRRHSLSEDSVLADPLEQFNLWWNDALNGEVDEANAMTLATSDKQGNPSARIVLLKGIMHGGFIFFTNYDSNKARQLADNPKACLVFFWMELERQVRITGTVSKISTAESDEYFASRPLLSKIGAWSSPQSSVIEGRELLEKKMEEYQTKFTDDNIPRPENWGGYLVTPVQLEFWQGRESRLHDRIQYSLRDDQWVIERLAP